MSKISVMPATLVEKRKQWLEVLSGDDQHSIMNQLTWMIWDLAAFRMINEARALAPEAREGGVQLNGMMHGLINRSFFTSQMVAIRRLVDNCPLEGKKGVYSLSALLDDMLVNYQLFTRFAIFEAEGLEYDFEPTKQAGKKYSMEQAAAGNNFWYVPPHLNSMPSERRHEHIDRLVNVKPSNRRRQDTIQKNILINLRKKVTTSCEDVKTRVDKFIAHSASPESRNLVRADDVMIALNDICEAHRHLCQVSGFLAIYVLGSASCPYLATPLFDQFLYMDKPLIKPSQISVLKKKWDELDKDCHKWSQWGLDEYKDEFGTGASSLAQQEVGDS